MNSFPFPGTYGRAQITTPERCDELYQELVSLPEHYWYPGLTGHYLMMSNLPYPIQDMVRLFTPGAPSWIPNGVLIKRLRPGEAGQWNIDSKAAHVLTLLPLRSSGDGTMLNNQFYPDEAGVATFICDCGPIVEVPTVNFLRLEIGYLFLDRERLESAP